MIIPKPHYFPAKAIIRSIRAAYPASTSPSLAICSCASVHWQFFEDRRVFGGGNQLQLSDFRGREQDVKAFHLYVEAPGTEFLCHEIHHLFIIGRAYVMRTGGHEFYPLVQIPGLDVAIEFGFGGGCAAAPSAVKPIRLADWAGSCSIKQQLSRSVKRKRIRSRWFVAKEGR